VSGYLAVALIARTQSSCQLPQFINVLQGRMSIVGLHGRHKVSPGITGWAQVNGWCGETDTLDEMKARIDYDLDYLRNWSLQLDLCIIAKTAWIVLKGENAH
jgi:putative colanic acid biosynthesis UDP-glucose lipid carrier transferase